MLQIAGGSALTAALAACGASKGGTASSQALPRPPRGIVFNTASKNVTLFDPGSNRVTGSHPISAVVRWLSNEQHYWDGRHIWTYDFPRNRVQALAIDPRTFRVVRRIPLDTAGPAHSCVLTPDNRRGFVNSAGSNVVAVVDVARGRVLDRIETGAYP